LYCRNSPGTPTGKKYALLASVKSTVPTLPRYSSNRIERFRHPAHVGSGAHDEASTWRVEA
jgi:hypothetical protein